ncbi:TetR/AcrR family transcriptional regulator [Fodinicola feengrottensis]|nr:TetR/AcrR family transcriptional regulator [Fodinicola feengrottensis]
MSAQPGTTAPSPRRRMRRADREQQLLDVAEQIFGERGFVAVTMEEIAEQAGVTKPVLYDHFGSKDGLAVACIARARSELLRLTVQAQAQVGTPEDILLTGFRVFFDFIESHERAWAMLVAEGSLASAPAAEELERVRQQQADYTAAVLAAGMPGVPEEVIGTYAQAIIGACERLAVRRRHDPELSPETVARSLAELVWFGISGIRDGARWPS